MTLTAAKPHDEADHGETKDESQETLDFKIKHRNQRSDTNVKTASSDMFPLLTEGEYCAYTRFIERTKVTGPSFNKYYSFLHLFIV